MHGNLIPICRHLLGAANVSDESNLLRQTMEETRVERYVDRRNTTAAEATLKPDAEGS